MTRVPRRNSKRKIQKQARKIQRPIRKRKKNHSQGTRLTAEQKKRRAERLAEREEAKRKRRLLRTQKVETEKINRIEKALSSVFGAEELNSLAMKVGFIKRCTGEITALSFVYIVSFGFFGNGDIALTYLTSGLREHFNVDVTPQALSKRINSLCSVKFIKCVLKELVDCQLNIGLKNRFSELLSMFNGVYLQDSTQVTLNEELSEDFKGLGGGASSSALKFDFTYDIANCKASGMKITDAATNDQSQSKEILKYIKEKSLVIRDLGYFTIKVLKGIQDKSAYYISRLSISAQVFLNKEDVEPLDLPAYLETLSKNHRKSSNIKIYVGKVERFESRLIAEKVPKHVAKQRTDRFKKDRKKEPSPHYVAWSGFSIFITNIPETLFSGKMILCLYKIRWQIELIFKDFKSNVEISIMKGTNKNRINTLIYGKLITIAVLFIIQNYAEHVAPADREISADKLAKILKSDNQLREAIIEDKLPTLLILLEHDILLVCKQKRNRKTTREQIEETLRNEGADEFHPMPSEIFVESKFEEIDVLMVV